MDRGATVLLCTDGLVERRDADLHAGLIRLQAVLAEHATLPLQELCDPLQRIDSCPLAAVSTGMWELSARSMSRRRSAAMRSGPRRSSNARSTW